MADVRTIERRVPVFGVDTLASVKPLRPPSLAEQDRIARHATHPSGIDTSRPTPRIPAEPIHFPEPKVIERDGKRFTTVGQGTHLYTGPNGEEGRELIGDLLDEAAEPEYWRRIPHPQLPDAMPSGELYFGKSVTISTGDERKEFEGVAYGDRKGLRWDGMKEEERRL